MMNVTPEFEDPMFGDPVDPVIGIFGLIACCNG